jgi:hypothetical protein
MSGISSALIRAAAAELDQPGRNLKHDNGKYRWSYIFARRSLGEYCLPLRSYYYFSVYLSLILARQMLCQVFTYVFSLGLFFAAGCRSSVDCEL